MSLLLWRPIAGTGPAPSTGPAFPSVPTIQARVAWRPEDITGTDTLSALDWNGASTAGWTIDGSAISGPVASLASTSSDSFGGGASLVCVTAGTAGSGVDFSLGTASFTSGREYRFRVATRTTSGSTSRVLRVGNATDFALATATTSSGWAWYTADWTPGTAVTDAHVSLQNATAAADTFRFDHAEVYEKLDEVTLDSLTVTRGSRFDGLREPPGRIEMSVLDPTDLYTPRNTASALYGAVEPGRRVHIRATYGGRLYPLAYGTIRDITPDPWTRTVRLSADDGLAELSGYSISRPFAVTGSYHEARAAALSDEALGTAQHSLATDSLESDTMVDGTDSALDLLAYLDGLNEATGTVHVCAPHVEAVRPWRYRTISRAAQTATTTGTIIDETFQRLTGVDLRDESYITRQRVSWRGYEHHGQRTVVAATAALPYWTFTDPEYGSSDTPSREDVFKLKWTRVNERIFKTTHRWRRVKRGTRWVDHQLPIRLAAGETVERIVDFDVPVEDMAVAVTDGGNVTTTTTIEPARVTISMTASSADTVTDITITGKPRIPLEEQEEVVTTAGAVIVRERAPIDNEHLGSAEQASGLATYTTWRYGSGRLRPEVVDQHHPARQLTLDVGSHVTLSADRWFIASAPTIVRSIQHDMSEGGLEFETTYGLEEVPTGGDWLTIGGGPGAGIGSSAVLAY